MFEKLKSEHFATLQWPVIEAILICVCFGKNKLLHCFVFFAGILARPLDSSDDMPIKIRVLQFISRINEGENIGEFNINAFRLSHLSNILPVFKLHQCTVWALK